MGSGWDEARWIRMSIVRLDEGRRVGQTRLKDRQRDIQMQKEEEVCYKFTFKYAPSMRCLNSTIRYPFVYLQERIGQAVVG